MVANLSNKAGMGLRFRMLAVLLLLPFESFCQESPAFQLTGTAINTTDPENPVAAPIQIVVRGGVCKLTVSPPLIGSGGCTIKRFGTKSGRIEVVSFGPPTIAWSGNAKGNFASGTYKIDVGAQTGSFYLALLRAAPKEPPSPPVAPPSSIRNSSCSPVIESSITGEVEGWSGETIFKLDNGQIWQQAEYDYTYFYEYHPDVTIYQTSAGCRMKVEDEDETLLVKRIK
jgi:hypothetical protein